MLTIYYSDASDVEKIDAHAPDNKLNGRHCTHFSTDNDDVKKVIAQENLTVFPVLLEINVVKVPDQDDQLAVIKLAEGIDAILAYNA